LPLLGINGFTGNIYATPATRDLANIIMMDSARIQARDAEYLGKQAARKESPSPGSPSSRRQTQSRRRTKS
jgi:Cft2 family RNA processing exonuclease